MDTEKPKRGEKLWGDSPFIYSKELNGISDERLISYAEEFYNKGYLHIKSGVSEEILSAAKNAYQEWCENKVIDEPRPDGRLPRVVNLHSERDELKSLYASSDEVTKVVDFLFGYKSSVYTSLTFQYGTEQPLPRDTPVFRTEPEEFYFGVWFALEDATEENGCLMALEGAHKHPWVDPIEFAKNNLESWDDLHPHGTPLWNTYQDKVVEIAKRNGHREVLIPAKAGDVVIWHPQLPHGGSKIKKPDKTRMSCVFHVVPEGVPVYQADVFFKEDANPARKSNFSYYEYKARQFVKTAAHFGNN